MTKTLMNKLRESLFWKSTDSWENKILVSERIYLENFELKINKIVVGLVEWSPRTTLRVNKVTMFNRFRCNLFKTNIKLEVTWWYSVVRVTWTIINWYNWIYNCDADPLYIAMTPFQIQTSLRSNLLMMMKGIISWNSSTQNMMTIF